MRRYAYLAVWLPLMTPSIAVLRPTPASAQVPVTYRVQDLGTFGGDLVGLAVNRNGDVAGYAFMPDGICHAIRWTRAGGLEDLGTNGGFIAQAFGINDNGDVVGSYATNAGGVTQSHGFLARRGGAIEDLSTPERQILRVDAITNDGRIAGMLMTSSLQTNAFRTLADGTLVNLGSPLFASAASRMNAEGEIAGVEIHNQSDDQQRAFLFTAAAGSVDLGSLGGTASKASSINNDGVVVGWSTGARELPQAFRARPGRPMEPLDGWPEGAAGGANDINDFGSIVGAMGSVAFIYGPGTGVVDLNSRLAPADRNRVLTDATAISASGDIVALYHDATSYRTVLLTPVVDKVPHHR